MRRVFGFALALLLPISVSAGLLGALGGIFSRSSDVLEDKKDKDLRTMNLLVATANPDATYLYHYDPVVQDDALIPNAGPVGTTVEASLHKPTSDQISVYVVREGDTLSQIAEMFDVTVNTIKWGNDLTSNVLHEGQTLVILPISGIKYTVVKGDTLQSIAKKYKGSVEEIIAYNSLPDNALSVGTTIIIPDGEVSSVAPSSSSGSGNVSGGTKDYSSYYTRPVMGGRRTQGIHGHNGVDIAAPSGTPIYAAASGEVIISRSTGWNGGYGAYVVVKHPNGTQTLYAHNQSNAVSAGDHVEQGDVIGYMGATGKATGVHLHFEVRGAKNPF